MHISEHFLTNVSQHVPMVNIANIHGPTQVFGKSNEFWQTIADEIEKGIMFVNFIRKGKNSEFSVASGRSCLFHMMKFMD